MNILVTGATGFLGSRTVEFLIQQPEVKHILATGRNTAFQPDFALDKVRYVYGDLSDEEFIKDLFDQPIDYVVNCASLSSPWGTYDQFYGSNVRSQQLLIDASLRSRVKRFIYISSPSIYFDFKNHEGLTEEAPISSRPVNHYATTKIHAERLLQESELEYITLRPRALIGRGDTVIMPRLIRAHREGRLKIMGDGRNHVDMTPVANMAEVIWLSMTTDSTNCREEYNISNGQPIQLWSAINDTLSQLDMTPPTKKIPLPILMAVARIMEWKARNLDKGREPTLTRYSVAVLARTFSFDISKARERLGFNPRQTIDQAIAEFVDWYKQQNP